MFIQVKKYKTKTFLNQINHYHFTLIRILLHKHYSNTRNILVSIFCASSYKSTNHQLSHSTTKKKSKFSWKTSKNTATKCQLILISIMFIWMNYFLSVFFFSPFFDNPAVFSFNFLSHWWVFIFTLFSESEKKKNSETQPDEHFEFMYRFQKKLRVINLEFRWL